MSDAAVPHSARVAVAKAGALFVSAAADAVATAITEIITRKGRATVGLTGGRTAATVYEKLATLPVRWANVTVIWGDERHVPPDHQDSNFLMASRTLLRAVPIPESQVHRVPAELPDATAAARVYDTTLRGVGPVDLLLLGIGEDGHIASLFPGSALLEESHGLVSAPWVRHLKAFRITLTPSAILSADRIILMAEGTAKAAAIHDALEGERHVLRCPAQLLRQAGGRATWILDKAAASQYQHA